MQHSPVSDLKKFIGINDKFAFINELFEGNLSSYNEAIERLNQSKDLNDALDYFEKALHQKYSWNSENATTQHLRNLVERRFMN